DLFREILGAGHQSGLGINLPSVDSILRTRSAKMRQAAPIFHAAKQQRRAIRQQSRARVKHTIDRVRPILTSEDRVCGMAKQQRLEASTRRTQRFLSGYGHNEISFASDSCRARISSSAIKNERVDSAPWFSLARSGCRPSRQPPVTESYRGSCRSFSPRNQLKADHAWMRQRLSPVTR